MATYDGVTSGATPAIKGTTNAGSNVPPVQGWSTDGNAVYGETPKVAYGAICGVNSSAGAGYGVYGEANGTAARGIYGFSSSSTGYGMYGLATGTSGYGVYGSGTYGVYGYTTVSYGRGVVGYANANSSDCYGVLGWAVYSTAYAGYFQGKVTVGGALYASTFSSGNKYFLIDHPLDPENRFLRHSSVESSEMKNVYDGVGTADDAGELAVQMPTYFEALNEDFRYQLTPLGAPAPNLHVKTELRRGRFVIAGAAAGQRLCWQVTGNRKDAVAKSAGLVVEEDKPADERGFYLDPEAHGQPTERGIRAERWRRAGGAPHPPPQP